MRGILIYIILFSISVAYAGAPVFSRAHDSTGCAQYLSEVAPRFTELDYRESDLEDLYLEIVSETIDFSSQRKRNPHLHIEQIMNLKALFLNKMGELMFYKMKHPNDVGVHNLSFDTAFIMIASFGVSPSFFGLRRDSDGRVSGRDLSGEQDSVSDLKKDGAVERGGQQSTAIGFIDQSGGPVRDLPEFQIRSLGFHPQKIRNIEPPGRKIGSIQFDVVEQTNTLNVTDFFGRIQYQVDLSTLAANTVETHTHKIQLSFHKDLGRWIVQFDNQANPSGKLGFIHAQN